MLVFPTPPFCAAMAMTVAFLSPVGRVGFDGVESSSVPEIRRIPDLSRLHMMPPRGGEWRGMDENRPKEGCASGVS